LNKIFILGVRGTPHLEKFKKKIQHCPLYWWSKFGGDGLIGSCFFAKNVFPIAPNGKGAYKHSV